MSRIARSRVEAALEPQPTSTRRLVEVAAKLYADGGGLTQRLRPYICPFEELLPAVRAGSSVLDVGCGAGLFLGLLAVERNIRLGVGFDSSASAIGRAQRMSRRAAENGSQAVLDFQCRDASASWPEGRFGVVSMIDVMHHVPREAQRQVFERAAGKLEDSGVLIYKDMARAPAWQAWANRLHDLLLAREWIQYAPIEAVEQWAAEAGLVLVDAREFDRYWYRHELRVFRRA